MVKVSTSRLQNKKEVSTIFGAQAKAAAKLILLHCKNRSGVHANALGLSAWVRIDAWYVPPACTQMGGCAPACDRCMLGGRREAEREQRGRRAPAVHHAAQLLPHPGARHTPSARAWLPGLASCIEASKVGHVAGGVRVCPLFTQCNACQGSVPCSKACASSTASVSPQPLYEQVLAQDVVLAAVQLLETGSLHAD